MKTVKILISLLLVFSFGTTQDITVDEVLDNIKLKAEGIEDAHFLLTGKMIDPDGTEIILEVDIMIMPKEQTTRAEFYQPDALADNFVILDKDAVYNYVYLTNQATVFAAGDPDALGGLLPAQENTESSSFDFDLEKLFAGWIASIESFEDDIYNLRFDNKEEDVVIDHVNVLVLKETWIPTEMIFVKKDDSRLAELYFEDLKIDAGLKIDDLLYIPDDAEIIDER